MSLDRLAPFHQPVPRAFDVHVDKGRNPIERFVNRIRQFCCIATRCDKRDRRYGAFVTAVAILISLA